MTPRITFRQNHATYRRRRLCYTVHRGGEHIATIAQLGNGQWYWYGNGVNTSHRPTTLDACKAEVKAHFKGKA